MPLSGAGEKLEIVPVVPTLSDGLITLRALAANDVGALTENCRDQAAVRWTTVPLDYTAAMARDFIQAYVPAGWREGTEQNFAVASADRDALLGTIGLHRMRPGTAEVGINMGPGARGTGAAEAAVRLLVDYAFDQLNLQYLFWQALVPNWASRKLAWKLGFTDPVTIRGFSTDRGVPADTWILALAVGDRYRPRQSWDGPIP